MKDLRYIFSYLKPYRRDMTLAVLLIFIECVFEMLIPLLMTDIVDVGVPNHDLRLLLLQGGKMALCALLALITGLLYARFAARAANGFGAELRKAEYQRCSSMTFPTWTAFPSPLWSPG